MRPEDFKEIAEELCRSRLVKLEDKFLPGTIERQRKLADPELEARIADRLRQIYELGKAEGQGKVIPKWRTSL